MLVITHDVQMVLRIADELVVLQDGSVVEPAGSTVLVADYSRRLLNTRLSTLAVTCMTEALLQIRTCKTFRTGQWRSAP